MCIDELHSMYLLFQKYKHHLQLDNNQLLNKMFVKHFNVVKQLLT